ncbi:unnamed protein product [Closterium sp. NIES-54]
MKNYVMQLETAQYCWERDSFDPHEFFRKMVVTLAGEVETFYRMVPGEVLDELEQGLIKNPTKRVIQLLKREFIGLTKARLEEFWEFRRRKEESLLAYYNRLQELAEDLEKRDERSEDYDVLVGMELLYKVGATICTWQEKVLYWVQYWDPESSVRTLPVRFVKQEPRVAYRAEETDLTHELDDWTWQEYAEEGQRRIEMHEGGRQSTNLKERVCRTWCLEGSLCILELYGGIGNELAAALKAGCFVGRWLHVERDPVVRKMARNYALKLLEEYPQQMLITTIPLEEEATVHDVQDIAEQQLEAWGPIDLVVAGWECQGYSRAGDGRGIKNPWGASFRDLTRVLRLIQKREREVVFILENVDMADDHREPVRRAYEEITEELGRGVPIDAAQLGSRAHRPRRWEEPNANEKELAMGHQWGATAHPEVSEAQRRAALGKAMDLNVMTWILENIHMYLKTKEVQKELEGSEYYREGREAAWRRQQLAQLEASREERIQERWAFMAVAGRDETVTGGGEAPTGAGEGSKENITQWEIGSGLGAQAAADLRNVLEQHKGTFAFTLKELGRCTVQEMRIQLSSDVPVYHKKRRMSLGDVEVCAEKCAELLEARLIQRSESEYVAATVLAARTDIMGDVSAKRIKTAAVLNRLLKEEQPWQWGDEEQKVLETLKRAVKTATVLTLPSKEDPVYLQGRPFTLVTDHQPLTWLMTNQSLTGRNARWAMWLQEYDFVIKHRPGKNMQHVDGLPRNPAPASPTACLVAMA